MLKSLRLFAFVLAGLYLAATATLCLFQRSLFYRATPIHQSIAAVGLANTSEIALTTADGVHITAWYSPGPPDTPTLVFFHGNGGVISSRHWRIRRGQKMGYGVMLVEYRGYGASTGSPTEEGLYADGRAALDWLDTHGVPTQMAILYGESLGSGVAVKLATERPVLGVILEAPYTSTVDVAARSYWLFPVRWLLWDRYDSLSRIKEIHTALLVMHGGADDTVPQTQGRALLAAAEEPKLGYFPSDAHHLDLVLHGAYDQIDQFIARFWTNAGQASCWGRECSADTMPEDSTEPSSDRAWGLY